MTDPHGRRTGRPRRKPDAEPRLRRSRRRQQRVDRGRWRKAGGSWPRWETRAAAVRRWRRWRGASRRSRHRRRGRGSRGRRQSEQRRLGPCGGRWRRACGGERAGRRLRLVVLVEDVRRFVRVSFLAVEDVRGLILFIPVHRDVRGRGGRLRGHRWGRRETGCAGKPRTHGCQRPSPGRRRWGQAGRGGRCGSFGRDRGRWGRCRCWGGGGHRDTKQRALCRRGRRGRRASPGRRTRGRAFLSQTLENVEVRSALFVLCHGTSLRHVPPT